MNTGIDSQNPGRLTASAQRVGNGQRNGAATGAQVQHIECAAVGRVIGSSRHFKYFQHFKRPVHQCFSVGAWHENAGVHRQVQPKKFLLAHQVRQWLTCSAPLKQRVVSQ